MRDFDVITPDGRTLSVLESGDPAGTPTLVHAGMPNSVWSAVGTARRPYRRTSQCSIRSVFAASST